MSDGIPSNENELVEEVSALPESRLEHLRKRACNSLYFMCKGVLGHRDLNPDTHGDFCKFFDNLDRSSDKFADRRMALMPRGYLKTTIATEGDSIRHAVRDPEYARILIANEIDQNARDILLAIRGHFERNPMLRLLFGHLIPSRFSGTGITWSSDGVSLLRQTSFKEPTFKPIGVGGAATSKHFTLIKCDDLIGLEAKRSPAEMKKAIKWVDNIESLIISEHETIIDYVGTRWSKRDLYNHVMNWYRDRMLVFRRKIIEQDEKGDDYITFPHKYSEKSIILLKQKPDVYFAQYMNDPISEEAQDFDENNLRYFTFKANGDVLVNGRSWPREALDVVISVDPNSGSPTAPDEFAITVSAMTPLEEILVLASYGGRKDPDASIDQLFNMCMRWRPRAVGIEKAGQQNTIHYFKKKMQKEGVYFNVVELHHKNVEKEVRIRTALATPIIEHRLFLLKSQDVMFHQISNFPDLENDDRIDSLAYGPQLWRRPQAIEEQEENDATVKLVLAARNKRTGY